MSGVIDRVTATGAVTPFVTIAGATELGGLTTDAAGNLYVGVPAAGAIDKVTPAGVVSTYATTGGYPFGLAFDRAGDLFAGSFINDTLYEVSPTGAVSTFASLDDVIGVAVDAAGDVYGSSPNSGRIEAFSPTGTDLGLYAQLPGCLRDRLRRGGRSAHARLVRLRRCRRAGQPNGDDVRDRPEPAVVRRRRGRAGTGVGARGRLDRRPNPMPPTAGCPHGLTARAGRAPRHRSTPVLGGRPDRLAPRPSDRRFMPAAVWKPVSQGRSFV